MNHDMTIARKLWKKIHSLLKVFLYIVYNEYKNKQCIRDQEIGCIRVYLISRKADIKDDPL